MEKVTIEIGFDTYKALFVLKTNPNQSDEEIIIGLLGLNQSPSPALIAPRENRNPVSFNQTGKIYFADYKKKGIKARAKYSDSQKKDFVVLKGSMASIKEDDKIPIYIHNLRQELRQAGILDANYCFTQDYIFNSISQAACVVYGGSRNGYKVWG